MPTEGKKDAEASNERADRGKEGTLKLAMKAFRAMPREGGAAYELFTLGSPMLAPQCSAFT